MNRLSMTAHVITLYMHEPYASLINGMVFGIPLAHAGSLAIDIRKSGLMHLVVLSGMNITLIHDTIRTLSASFGRRQATLISVLTTFLFSYLVGFEAPITRALVSSILTNVCISFGRKPHTLMLFVLTGLVCLTLVPSWFSSISFQLSYAATLGILLFSRNTVHESDPEGIWASLLAYVKSDARTSMGAQLLTVPLVWIYFQQISLVSPLSNILVSWTVLPLTIAATASSLLGLIYVPLGSPFGYISYGLSWYVVQVIRLMASIPFGFISLKSP